MKKLFLFQIVLFFSIAVFSQKKITIFVHQLKYDPFEYPGFAANIDNKAYFISDYADSQAYLVDSLNPWNEELLKERFIIKGVLVENNNGVLIFKNWSIIK
ncbi:MAG: hypothetical protein JXL97_20020 [Bacteroidales bacterium]|nr:hypothetical protein [Bacteroidales bacterium]